MEDIKWRFKGNNYMRENGLDAADVETYKKDPLASLAREICQNSLDAKREEEKKSKVIFKTFSINTNAIPGFKRLREEIENCKEYKYKKNSENEYNQLCKMIDVLNNEKIDCIRISDYNTTGLIDDKFHLLTKGSGITDKSGDSGGSKGIGKYACFVTSKINTVFYSTQLEKTNEKKSIGICRLCSAPMPNTLELTDGMGIYGTDFRNNPMADETQLEEGYERTTPGTDIYSRI